MLDIMVTLYSRISQNTRGNAKGRQIGASEGLEGKFLPFRVGKNDKIGSDGLMRE